MITNSAALNRRRRRDDRQQNSRITASDAQLYRDLAQTSGGLAIEVAKSELPEAIGIITQSSSSSLVISQTVACTDFLKGRGEKKGTLASVL